MKKTILLLLTLVLAISLMAGCDMQNGRVSNSPAVTLTPGNTPGHTPVVTDVPSPTATNSPSATPDFGTSATPGAGTSHTGAPASTAAPTANTTAGFRF